MNVILLQKSLNLGCGRMGRQSDSSEVLLDDLFDVDSEVSVFNDILGRVRWLLSNTDSSLGFRLVLLESSLPESLPSASYSSSSSSSFPVRYES